MVFSLLRAVNWSNSHINGILFEVQLDDAVAYLRENIKYDSFLVPANVRLGIKRGQFPSDSVQVLELCASESYWEAIAQEVRALDKLNRPIVHGKFGRKWALSQFEQSSIIYTFPALLSQ